MVRRNRIISTAIVISLVLAWFGYSLWGQSKVQVQFHTQNKITSHKISKPIESAKPTPLFKSLEMAIQNETIESITVFNMLGVKLAHYTPPFDNLMQETYLPGIYFLHVQTTDGLMTIRKTVTLP